MKTKIKLSIYVLGIVSCLIVNAEEIIPYSETVDGFPVSSNFNTQNISQDINTILETQINTFENISNEVSEEILSTSTITYQQNELENIEYEGTHFLIRNNEHVIFDSNIEIATGTYSITDTQDRDHIVEKNSVLAVLKKIDDMHDDFEITKIQYYDSIGALYLKCIRISEIEYCDNWQYVVNGESPWTGIDQTILKNGDNVGIYFGNPYQLVFDTNTYVIDNPFFVTAQKYNYETDTWIPRTNVTIGIINSNPNDLWSPIEYLVSPVNELAVAEFVIATSGNYSIGVKEDWYYPLHSIVVGTSSDLIGTSTSSNDTNGSGSTKKTFDIEKALNFLKMKQSLNGSFGGSELYSDWVAIAFNSYGEKNQKLLEYIFSKSKVKDSVTDNERRVMTLLSYGKNPYTFNGVNYIKAIIDEFDGLQIGDKNLVNDDIFGLLILGKSGYDTNDIQIQKIISFILSKQNSNGSWEYSYDLTASAISVLSQFESVSGVSSSIEKAKIYLKNGQLLDGGWGSVYTTAWVAQAMYALGENWIKNSKTVQDYFLIQQQVDGGVLSFEDTDENRVWATSYIIPAVLEKSWFDILYTVQKPINTNSDIKQLETVSTSTVASTTIPFESIATIDTSQEDLFQLDELNFYVAANNNIEQSIELVATETIQIIPSSTVASVNQIQWLYQWVWYVFAVICVGCVVKFLIKFS